MGKNYYPVILTELTEMKTYTLSVILSGASDFLEPTLGKKIRLLGIITNVFTGGSTASDVPATVAYGDAAHVNKSKIIYMSHFLTGANINMMDTNGVNMNLIGGINEKIRLTNRAFSAGSSVISCTLYYREE